MGVVYLAEDPELSRQVALKVLSPELAADDSFRQRFAREWRLAASLEHPNVIPIHGAGEDNGVLWIAMRYVHGTDLRTLLHDEGPLEPELAVAVLSQVAAALDAAHALGLVHRDVKPANILLAGTVSEGFHAYLADFGLTKRIVSSTSLTQTGAFVGTVAYAAPEQVENTPLDGRADQYALACVAYHCLAGQAPFADREDLGALWAHVFEPPPSLTSRRPGLPPGLDSALARGMAKSPDDRYPSCADMVRSLRAQVAGASQVALGPTPEKTRPSHDVFLSHHRADREAARRVAEALHGQGLKAFLPETGLDPERDWREQLEAALRDSAACVVLVGPGSLGEWERQDLRLARSLSSAGTLRLVPVLLPGLPDPFDPTVLPDFLASRAWVDLRTGLDDERAVRDLLRVARGTSRTSHTPQAEVSSPYRGLQAFQEEDAPFFFGREGDVQRLVELLKATSFLAVVGPSGSGKSSLARAGLIPALRAGALPGSESWQIRLVRPGAEPLVTLAAELLGLGSGPGMGATVDQLARDPRTLHLATSLAMGDRETSERVAWVVDQFEEAFTLCHDEAEREAFVANLLHSANAPGGRDLVVLTVRADFYPRLAAHPALAPAVAAHQFVVPPLDAEGLRLAVEGPAKLAGARFEEGLVDTILADTRAEPGALPLLEHALLELWERRAGSVLSLEGYRASGGVAGAIAARAEAAYTALPPERQAVCCRVMLRLAQPGEGTEDTRRRARVAELATGPDDVPAVNEVLDSLVVARLVTASADEQGEPWVEVGHEALIRAWPRLRGWLEEDRAGLRLHRRLTEAAEEWDRLGRDGGALWRGARLLQSAEWRVRNEDALNPLEHEFLDSSEAQADQEAREIEDRRQKELEGARKIAAAQRRSARLFRLVAFVLVLGLAASGIATKIAIGARNSARREGQRAQQQAAIALSRQLAAQALGQLDVDPELSLLLSIKAEQASPTSEAEFALRRSLAESHVRAALRGLGPIQSAAFTPDGKQILEVGDSGVRLWEWQTGKVSVLETSGASVVDLSSDGRYIVTATDYGVRIWDVASGTIVKTLPEKSVIAAALSPDGRYLATASGTDSATLWDVSTGSIVHTLDATGSIEAIVFSMDGNRVGTASSSTSAVTVRVWAVPSGQQQGHKLRATCGAEFGPRSQTGKPTCKLTSLAFSPDDNSVKLTAIATFVNGGGGPETKLWTLPEGKVVSHFGGSRMAQLPSLDHAFSSDGRLLATPFLNGAGACLTDTATGRGAAEADWTGGALDSASFSPEGQYLITGSGDGTAQIWEIPSQRGLKLSAQSEPGICGGAQLKSVLVLRGHSAPIQAADFSPDGKLVVTASRDGSVRVWDPGLTPALSIAAPGPVAFSPDGSIIAVGTQLLDARSGSLLRVLPTDVKAGETVAIYRLGFSPNGRYLAAVIDASHVHKGRPTPGVPGSGKVTFGDFTGARVWDVQTGDLLLSDDTSTFNRLPFSAPPLSEIFSHDSRLVILNEGKSAVVMDVSTGRTAHTFEVSGPVQWSAFSPEGTYVAVADAARLQVWNAHTYQRVSSFAIQTSARAFPYPLSFTFDPFAQYIATASTGGVTLWDPKRGRRLRSLTDQSATRAEFSPAGDLLLTYSNDPSIQPQLWDPATGNSLALPKSPYSYETHDVFNSDGQLIVSFSDAIRVVEPRTGSVVSNEPYPVVPPSVRARLRADQTQIPSSLVFSPSGTSFASYFYGVTEIFPCDVCGSPPQLLKLALTRVTRGLTKQEQTQYLPTSSR